MGYTTVLSIIIYFYFMSISHHETQVLPQSFKEKRTLDVS